MRYVLTVDGKSVAADVDPSTPLLLVLRNDAGVVGPKFGCGLGQCGSCAVLIDGEPVRSCVRSMSSLAEGAAITTVAGLGTSEKPHPVQAAFIAEQALQCGYCASGMIVAAAALLAKKPDPTDGEIREALDGHLCRCGTHDRIVRAVKRAAGKSDGVSAAAAGLVAIACAMDVGRAAPTPPGPDVGERLVCSPQRAQKTASTRRAVLGGAGFLLLGFCLGGRTAFGQEAPASPSRLPGSLASNKSLDAWLRIGADGTVTVLSGKVELGQGIRTALAQIVADELDVAIDRLRMVPADTDLSPDESYTSGSMSIQQSGAALRQAAAEARLVLLELAATRLGVAVADLRVEDGRVAGGGSSTTYWELVSDTTLHLEATGRATPKPASARRLVGRPVQRLDIPAKVFGEPAFVHDLRLPGMLHARVVRPPGPGSRLTDVDVAATRALPGVVAIVRDGSFLAVVAEREEQAIAGADSLTGAARWDGSGALPADGPLSDWLRRVPSREGTVSSKGTEPPPAAAAAAPLVAEYSKPFIAHASLGPSCAVAQVTGDRLRVWTHGQGVFPMRAALAKLLGLPPDRIRVTHMEGAGCYGHNGADDAACDAALIARALDGALSGRGEYHALQAQDSGAADGALSGRPVRVQWSRQDEQAWAPFGSAMAMRVRGGLDAEGGVAWWAYDLWSHTHSTRPGREAGFVAAWHLATPQPPPMALNIPQPSGGEDRNAVPLYDFPSQRVVEHLVPEMPVRVSALRSLGAFANVFAIESFIDELATAAGADPVAFRLRHLSDQRGRAVIERAARAAGWTEAVRAAAPAADGLARGRGFGFARYKNQAAYVAVAAEVAVDRGTGAIRVERVTGAVDAGDVVNPDGLRNQIEGGIVQAASWTLFEEVTFDRERITSVDWRSYPIARFDETPLVTVEVIERPNDPPVGAGEAAQGPTAAAIANAVFAATGARLRELPMRPTRLLRALEASA